MQKQRFFIRMYRYLVTLVFAVLWGGIALVQAQAQQDSTMEQRLNQLIDVLLEAEACEIVDVAIDDAMGILYGGLRPLPSKGDMLDKTKAADTAIRKSELKFARVLQKFTKREVCPEQRGRALDLKLFIEEISEIAQAVGKITAQCGQGDSLQEQPCDELQPLLNEKTGEEFPLGLKEKRIVPSFSVKLRSPTVPRWSYKPQEDIRVTGPIGRGQCVAVFKETRGLMVRLHLQRITIVTDPWVTVFGFPRGTRTPIWRLEWVPAEYVKVWNLCNVRGKRIVTTVTQKVKQQLPLNFFWRFYPKDP